MLQKTKTVLAILSVLAIFTACSKINPKNVWQEAAKFRYVINLSVNVNRAHDPYISIRTNEFEINEDAHSITIKGPALMSSNNDSASHAIQLSGVTTFSFLFGGKIDIKDHQTKKILNIEKYNSLKTRIENN